MPLRSKWRFKFQNIYAERCGVEIATFVGSMIWSYIPNGLEGVDLTEGGYAAINPVNLKEWSYRTKQVEKKTWELGNTVQTL